MSVRMTEYKPPPSLAPYIELFWDARFNTKQEHLYSQKVVPNGYIELIIHTTDVHCHLSKYGLWSPSPDYTIIGLFTSPYEVRFKDIVNVFGVRFKPEAIYNLFGIPASEFHQKYEDMESILGPDFHSFCSRLREAEDVKKQILLAENYFSEKLQKIRNPLSYVNHAAEIIRKSNGFLRIEDLCNNVFIGLRQLQRQFKQVIGISPKMYMRISRLNTVNQLINDQKIMNLTEIAFQCGYADQSHFIRDFKSIIGASPSFFISNNTEYIVNVNTALDIESQSL